MRGGEFADLTAFIAIADHLSFRTAAAQLRVTPSALSHTMRQLEERLGTRLLNRTTRSVSLTGAGERLLQRLRPAVDQIATAIEDLEHERGRPSGRLRSSHSFGRGFSRPIPKSSSRFKSTRRRSISSRRGSTPASASATLFPPI
jgi:DNA-binding transcriptional LysR family regulator